jgi:type II secretory pathway pseudopilin PulG
MENKKLTLIEIIIATAVIGILATLASLGVNGAQKKTRDNRRIEDMNIIRSAMKIIYNQTGSYNGQTCQEGALVADCRGEEIVKLINNINQLKDPASKGISCVQNFGKDCDYAFSVLNDESFSVLFYLEEGTQGLVKGQHILTEKGFQ